MNHPEEMLQSAITEQMNVLNEVMSASRYQMTDFEIELWMGIAKAVPKEQFMAFLRHHVLTSPYPPKPSDANQHFGSSKDPALAYETLRALVRENGPWNVPEQADAVMVATIQSLGGWIAVNEQLPDVRESHAVRAYRERFDACFNAAISQVSVRKQLPTKPLIALGNDQPTSQLLISRPTA